MNNRTIEYLRNGVKVALRKPVDTLTQSVLFAQKFDMQSTELDWAVVNGVTVGDDEVLVISVHPNQPDKPLHTFTIVNDIEFEDLYVVLP